MPARAPNPKLRQRGVGLLEILIAVVLVSIGFLAAAKMQVQGMRFSQGAYYQSQAYFMANEMADRMRANVVGVAAGLYDGQSTRADATDPGCQSSACDPTALRNQDIFDWSAALHPIAGSTGSGFVAQLPGSDTVPAQGTITALGGGLYRITLQWSEAIDGADTRQSLSFNFAIEVPSV